MLVSLETIIVGVVTAVLGGVAMLAFTRFFDKYNKRKDEEYRRLERGLASGLAVVASLRIVLNGKGDIWYNVYEQEYEKICKERGLE